APASATGRKASGGPAAVVLEQTAQAPGRPPPHRTGPAARVGRTGTAAGGTACGEGTHPFTRALARVVTGLCGVWALELKYNPVNTRATFFYRKRVTFGHRSGLEPGEPPAAT